MPHTFDIPIVRVLNMPTKSAFAALAAVGEQLNRARCCYARNGWVVVEVAAKGADKKRPAVPKRRPQFSPYGIARDQCREIHSKLVASAVRDVSRALTTRLPYDAPEKKHGLRYVWEAIEQMRRNPPSFRAIEIPVPNQDAKLCYSGDGDAKLTADCGDRCVIDVPIWSKEAGRKVTRMRLELDPKRAPKVLRAIAKGEQKMADSSIALNGKGKWVLRLVADLPKAEPLDKEKSAELLPSMPDARHGRPFTLKMPGYQLGVGNGRFWVAERIRLEARRKNLRQNSRDHQHGHGKKAFFAKLRPYSRKGLVLQDRFRKQAVGFIVERLTRDGVGILVYREPSKPLRDKCWFGDAGLPVNWTEFANYLKHKCEMAGIEFKVAKITLKEARDGKEAKAAGLRRMRAPRKRRAG